MRPEHIGALGCQRWANGWCSAPHLLLYCTSICASGLLVVLWCGQGVALHRQSKTAGVLGSLHAQSDVAASTRVRPYLLTEFRCGCRQAVLGFFVGCAYGHPLVTCGRLCTSSHGLCCCIGHKLAGFLHNSSRTGMARVCCIVSTHEVLHDCTDAHQVQTAGLPFARTGPGTGHSVSVRLLPADLLRSSPQLRE